MFYPLVVSCYLSKMLIILIGKSMVSCMLQICLGTESKLELNLKKNAFGAETQDCSVQTSVDRPCVKCHTFVRGTRNAQPVPNSLGSTVSSGKPYAWPESGERDQSIVKAGLSPLVCGPFILFELKTMDFTLFSSSCFLIRLRCLYL